MLVLCSVPAQGMKLSAVYTGSCDRSLGVIVGVGEDQITLLNMQGDFVQISRYEIIYLAHYPLGNLPLPHIDQQAGAPKPYRVKTVFAGELRPLVEGWPIDFDEDQISFLGLDGHEQVIDRNAIWELERTDKGELIPQTRTAQRPLKFTHPYPFAYCPNEGAGQRIDPQYILGEPLLIKKELDQLHTKFKDLETYDKDKRFYPVPQVYRTNHKLGLWFSLASRYGSSKNRSNNFAPVFESGLSEGPFGFQRVMITGSARMNYTLHSEPQNQFYYRLKSDYVHFSFMYDIERIMLGEETYKWQAGELSADEHRINETQHIGGGFDYGNWAIGYELASLQYGVKVGPSFFRSRVVMDRPHLIFHHRWLKAELFYGKVIDGKVNNLKPPRDSDTPEQVAERNRLLAELAAAPNYLMQQTYYRFNLYPWPDQGYRPEVSLILRDFGFEREANQASPEETAMQLFEKTRTLSVAGEVGFFSDVSLKGFFSWEQAARRSGELELTAKTANYFKTGFQMGLTF